MYRTIFNRDVIDRIIGYGFSPLKLDPELDFMALFHGVDERVPISGLEFGVNVLADFLENC